ncbi:MAG: chorismate synthase [Vicinamibacterales bacterium]
MLRFLTAGESHGQALTVVVDGLPAGLRLDLDRVAHELRRRQGGYGRGRRMEIERDTAEVLSGVRGGETIGSPVALLIRNRDWVNWQHTMAVGDPPPADASGAHRAPVTRPRPGHADLAGAVKFERSDMRDVLERASARETAARVAVGALARQLLVRLGLDLTSHVWRIGEVALDSPHDVTFAEAAALAWDAPLRCVDQTTERAMIGVIERAKAAGDTVGGSFEIIVTGVPPGLGSYTQWDRRLDGRLAQALMSIPAIKGVGIGVGEEVARRPGSQVHDAIVPSPVGGAQAEEALGPMWRLPVARPTNRAGGLEGGVTNGADIRVTAHMKPISTLMKPLASVDLASMTPSPAAIERSDVCAVPAAAVVGEAMVAVVLADAVLERFGGDTVPSIVDALEVARERAARYRAAGAPPV